MKKQTNKKPRGHLCKQQSGATSEMIALVIVVMDAQNDDLSDPLQQHTHFRPAPPWRR
jgi:hypothetical protein